MARAGCASLWENGDHHKQMAELPVLLKRSSFSLKASGVGNYGHLIKVDCICIVRFSENLMNLYFVDTIRMRF